MNDTIRCRNCGVSYDLDTRLCVKCGTDLITGKSLFTRTGVEEVEEAEPETKSKVRDTALSIVGQLLPGLLRSSVVIFSTLGLVVASLIGGYAIWAIHEGSPTGAAMMLGLAVLVNAQATAWLVTGEFQLLVDAVSEMGGRIAYYIPLVLVSLASLSWVAWLLMGVETG